jgi:predicted GIY-YIG superfamily endonuclease
LTRQSIKPNELLDLHPREQARWHTLCRRDERSGTAHLRTPGRFGRRVTKRYGIKSLVYFEPHQAITTALQREKNIKHWSREWKIDLIVGSNPDWRDLYEEIVR